MKLLNVGCGSTFHPAWINIDAKSFSPCVQTQDIRKGLAFSNASFDGCYSSHLLEHLVQTDAKSFLAETFRVLKTRGIMRIVVPDLEAIVRNYLSALEQVEVGVTHAEADYDWIMLELYDQTIRSFSGGEMSRHLTNPDLKNKDFILSRIGFEAESHWTQQDLSPEALTWNKIKSKKLSWFVENFRIKFIKSLVRLIAGNEVTEVFEEGLFRNSGEIHRWMYDRFSLRRMLEQSGFVDVSICRADESRIPDFNNYDLDIVEGKVRKPDSLFMEGIRS